MYNVCHQCGLYRADKVIDPAGPFAICPECGHKHPFRQLPLLIVAGASGTGKSTVCNALLGKQEDVVLLDSDILWRPEFNQPENNYRDFFETWLRVAKNIGQSDRPVVLFGAGLGVPENIEPCIERRYFAAVHRLGLVCDDEDLARRLRARPSWRGCGEPGYIEGHINFNRWFKNEGAKHPSMTLIDTTGVPLAQTVEQVKSWMRKSASRHV